MNCFAQSTNARVRDLQGEWTWISIQEGNQFLDLTELSNTIEIILKIDGNNFFIVELDRETGEKIVETGMFNIFSYSLDLLVVSGQRRKNYLYPYTLQGNILRVVSDGTVIVMHRKIANSFEIIFYY